MLYGFALVVGFAIDVDASDGLLAATIAANDFEIESARDHPLTPARDDALAFDIADSEIGDRRKSVV